MNNITPAECISIIKKYIPDVKDEDIIQNKDGWNCLVFIVQSRTVFRFPAYNFEEFIQKFLTEIEFVNFFAPLSPIRIPLLKKHTTENGFVFCSYDYIQGETLSPPLANRFSAENKFYIASQLGNFLSVLHQLPFEKVTSLGVTKRDIKEENLQTLSKTKDIVFPHISKDLKRWIEGLYEEYFDLLNTHPPVFRVCHYDFMPKHWIVDPQKESLNGIIDFGNISIGDPADDFTSLSVLGNDFLEQVYKAYTLPKDSGFEKRRQFYQRRHMVTDSMSALQTNDHKRFTESSQVLEKFINNHI